MMKKVHVLIVCACVSMLCPIAALAQNTVPRGGGFNRDREPSTRLETTRPETSRPETGRPDSNTNQAPAFDSQPMSRAATRPDAAPPEHYQGERTSNRNTVSGQAPTDRYAGRIPQLAQNKWKETVKEKDKETDKERVVAYAIPPGGSFADLYSNVSDDVPLKWTNPAGLAWDKRQFLTNVRNAQQSGSLDVYTCYRQRIQFIEDPDGACVVYVSPHSLLRGRIAVGDVILALDGQPINDPWDVELRYRWTRVEVLKWSGAVRSFWVWLGMH